MISYLLFTLPLIPAHALHKTSVETNPDIIYVPQDYPTIQESINHANPGDTIFVSNRTYYEHVVINKSVSLVGQDRDSTIIDGNRTNSVVQVTANNININNFTIQNGGIGLYDSSIFVEHSTNINITHTMVKNSSNGICLSYAIGNTILRNTASDNKYGISLYSSENNDIYGNNASDNKYGIALYSSNNNKIYGNNAYSNGINGIHIQSSSNNIVSNNTASSNNFDGIRLEFSSNNVISDNTISKNDYGIRLHSSTDNTVSSNTASNNYYGIYVDSSSNNTIHHNTLNNTDQVWSDSVNIWDGDEEGNYWSDYNGADLYRGPYQNETGSDGIGDTPYVIDANNQDRYPLMGIFSDFKVAWKDKTHHATTICNSTISNFRFEIGKETGNKIVSFNVAGEDGTIGFCRVMIPIELMKLPPVVLIDEEEIAPTLLDASNKTGIRLYFTYVHSSHAITVISSRLMFLYNELLDRYLRLQTDFQDLNSTYHELLDNYSQLQEQYDRLNTSHQELQGNHTSLLFEHAQSIRSLLYVFIATITIFIIATVYLSTHAHKGAFKSQENERVRAKDQNPTSKIQYLTKIFSTHTDKKA